MVDLKFITAQVSYGKTWKGFATIQRNLDTRICKITFNSLGDIRKYLSRINNEGLTVSFFN